MKKRERSIRMSRPMIIFFIVLLLSLIIFLFAQWWVIRTVRSEKQEQAYAMLNLIRTTTDLSVDQAFKLSQLLLLDNTIAKFMYQGPIEGGSGEIQSLIDAKSVLPVATGINAMLAEIYLYSNRSGYILCSTNAFLDPEQMYPSLFAFQDLNYRQFRTRYLTPSFSRSFFPQVTAIVHGRERRVIPLVQTFPLNNPTSNAGKVVMLLDADYFTNLLSEPIEGANPTVYITDLAGRLIMSSGDPSLIQGEQYRDGQHRLAIDGEAYILSVLSSEASGLRFHSLLRLSEINAMLSPMWSVVAALSIGTFLVLSLSSMLIMIRSNRSWNKLLGLVGDGERPLPYEQAVRAISSIVAEDRSAVRQKGGTPFIIDTFFRRLIHGRMLTTTEIEAMLRQAQADIDLTSALFFQMIHIAASDAQDVLSDELLEDLDFTRIVAAKQADEIFSSQHYLYMDSSFSIWVMIWHVDCPSLQSRIDRFYHEFSKVSPLSFTMAASSAKQQLDEIFTATVECSEVQQRLTHDRTLSGFARHDALSFKKDPYHYTTEMERKLHTSVIRGDLAVTGEVLSTIEEENFSKRSLGSEEHANLMRSLYASAITLSQSLRAPLPSSLFTSAEEARRFFLSQAEAVGKAKSDSDEGLIGRIVSYIEAHYTDVSLNLSHMAAAFSMKESFLYHFMMTRMESSFAQYLESYRLERARTIFAEAQISIAEVTLLVGYASPQTFRRAFQKRYGILPSEYQKTVLYRHQE
ncbi:MAG: AraC family transcriptional regulator [Sphaerochaeta sp.]|jgi:AraC-like DNA-binding protein|nr:AraC family transcriptional regulator [Sphaerochaeta sp.]